MLVALRTWTISVASLSTSALRTGLDVKAFDGSDRLRDFFNVISVTADRDGVFYASTMEAKKVCF